MGVMGWDRDYMGHPITRQTQVIELSNKYGGRTVKETTRQLDRDTVKVVRVLVTRSSTMRRVLLRSGRRDTASRVWTELISVCVYV